MFPLACGSCGSSPVAAALDLADDDVFFFCAACAADHDRAAGWDVADGSPGGLTFTVPCSSYGAPLAADDEEMGTCVSHGPWLVQDGPDCPSCFPPPEVVWVDDEDGFSSAPPSSPELDALVARDVAAGRSPGRDGVWHPDDFEVAPCGHEVPAGFRCACLDDFHLPDADVEVLDGVFVGPDGEPVELFGPEDDGFSAPVVAASYGPQAAEIVAFASLGEGYASSQTRWDEDGVASGAVVCRGDLLGSVGVRVMVQRLLVEAGYAHREVFPELVAADAELEEIYEAEQAWLAAHRASPVAAASWSAFHRLAAPSCPECGELPLRGSSPLVPFEDAVEFPDVWSPDQVVVSCLCCDTYFTVSVTGTLSKTTQV